jgi:hypothetical protein
MAWDPIKTPLNILWGFSCVFILLFAAIGLVGLVAGLWIRFHS